MSSSSSGRVMGFDPGYGITGWGFVRHGRRGFDPGQTAYGVISTSKNLPVQERMASILREARELLDEHDPDCVVVEKLFMNKNIKTAGEVYQARGVLLAAVAEHGAELLELTPNRIKQMITGHGSAGKREVILMVGRLLNIRETIAPDDAADALAGALCGAFYVSSHNILTAATVGRGGPRL